MVRPASAAASSTTSVGEVRETLIRSLIGPQADSRKESAPSYGFELVIGPVRWSHLQVANARRPVAGTRLFGIAAES